MKHRYCGLSNVVKGMCLTSTIAYRNNLNFTAGTQYVYVRICIYRYVPGSHKDQNAHHLYDVFHIKGHPLIALLFTFPHIIATITC